ncbi:MAG: putative signal transducing protein [Omnitrophica WOR_2 bacterium]
MAEIQWEVVDEVAGDLQAEILRGLLEAQEIQVWLSQEGAGKAYGVGLGRLGRVQILVPDYSAEAARQLLEEYYSGKLEAENPPVDDPLPEEDLWEDEDQG